MTGFGILARNWAMSGANKIGRRFAAPSPGMTICVGRLGRQIVIPADRVVELALERR